VRQRREYKKSCPVQRVGSDFKRKWGGPMAFVQSSAVIQVDMSVTRYRPFPEDGLVEVWGHVGDYEVCVHLPLEEARSRGLLGKKTRRGAAARQEKPEQS